MLKRGGLYVPSGLKQTARGRVWEGDVSPPVQSIEIN